MKKWARGRRRRFRHFRRLFPSNPPSGIFGFYPGKGSAYWLIRPRAAGAPGFWPTQQAQRLAGGWW
jgi:hypothetical protein